MIFLTMDEEQIDISEAQRIFVRPRMRSGTKCWVVVVEIADVEYDLVSAGDSLRQAIFHCKAMNECQLNRKVTGEEIYGY
jgi:hypothetical protein